jgi:hypothetical protein
MTKSKTETKKSALTLLATKAKRSARKWVAPKDLDPKCYELCAALNELDGITTMPPY